MHFRIFRKLPSPSNVPVRALWLNQLRSMPLSVKNSIVCKSVFIAWYVVKTAFLIVLYPYEIDVKNLQCGFYERWCLEVIFFTVCYHRWLQVVDSCCRVDVQFAAVDLFFFLLVNCIMHRTQENLHVQVHRDYIYLFNLCLCLLLISLANVSTLACVS